MRVLPNAAYRVSLGLPVQARTLLQSPIETSMGDTHITLSCDDDSILSRVEFMRPTTFDSVPKFERSRRHLKIYEPHCPNCEILIQASQRFEGVFTAFGIISVDHEYSTWKWEFFDEDKLIWETYFENTACFEDEPITSEPLPSKVAERLAEMALMDAMNFEALTLTLIRQGNNHFQNGRYIDAIRSFYLGIEHQCANSQSGKNRTIQEFSASEQLQNAFETSSEIVGQSLQRGDISRKQVDELLLSQKFEDFATWLFKKRGELFHQKARLSSHLKWWPSYQIPHKADAIVVRAVALSLAREVTWSKYSVR